MGPHYRARKQRDRRGSRSQVNRPGVLHAWTAAAARQSVTVGSKHPHPITKNVGATVAARGQRGGTRKAAKPLRNRNPCRKWICSFAMFVGPSRGVFGGGAHVPEFWRR